jgi:hypothetical protein
VKADSGEGGKAGKGSNARAHAREGVNRTPAFTRAWEACLCLHLETNNEPARGLEVLRSEAELGP